MTTAGSPRSGARPLRDTAQTQALLPQLEPIHGRTDAPVYSEITRRVLDYVSSGSIAPGSKLPSERVLAQELGVGRSHVRQAIRSLVVLGLLDVRQGDGTYLKRMDSPVLTLVIEWQLLLGGKDTTDLVEARHHLEIIVAGLAAQRRDPSDVVELSRLLDIMKRSTSDDEFIEADLAFHMQLAKAAGNAPLAQIMSRMRSLHAVWIGRVRHLPGWAAPTCAEHELVLAAVERGDPVTARDAMRAHMGGATSRLRQTLTEDD